LEAGWRFHEYEYLPLSDKHHVPFWYEPSSQFPPAWQENRAACLPSAQERGLGLDAYELTRASSLPCDWEEHGDHVRPALRNCSVIPLGTKSCWTPQRQQKATTALQLGVFDPIHAEKATVESAGLRRFLSCVSASSETSTYSQSSLPQQGGPLRLILSLSTDGIQCSLEAILTLYSRNKELTWYTDPKSDQKSAIDPFSLGQYRLPAAPGVLVYAPENLGRFLRQLPHAAVRSCTPESTLFNSLHPAPTGKQALYFQSEAKVNW
jgi:hypothetical protein